MCDSTSNIKEGVLGTSFFCVTCWTIGRRDGSVLGLWVRGRDFREGRGNVPEVDYCFSTRQRQVDSGPAGLRVWYLPGVPHLTPTPREGARTYIIGSSWEVERVGSILVLRIFLGCGTNYWTKSRVVLFNRRRHILDTPSTKTKRTTNTRIHRKGLKEGCFVSSVLSGSPQWYPGGVGDDPWTRTTETRTDRGAIGKL